MLCLKPALLTPSVQKTSLRYSFILFCFVIKTCTCPPQVLLLQSQTKWCSAWCSRSTPLKSSMFRLVQSSIDGVTTLSLTSILLSINTFLVDEAWAHVSFCWRSGHSVTITLLLHYKQTAQLRWRRPVKWNARRWMLWLFLLPSLLAEHSVSKRPAQWKQKHFHSGSVIAATASLTLISKIWGLIVCWCLIYGFLFFQLHYYLYLWRRSSTYKTIGNKLSTFFKGPSWKPGKSRLGDHEDNPKVSKKKRKNPLFLSFLQEC